MKAYNDFEAVDFLKDDSFLKSIFLLSEEDVLFWKKFASEHPEKAEELARAKEILASIKFNYVSFSSREKQEMLEQINKGIRLFKRKKIRRNIFRIAAAACLAGLISISYVFFIRTSGDNEQPVAEQQKDTLMLPNEKNTQLILANNETVVFDNEANITYKEGGEIITGSKDKDVLSIDIEKNKNKYNRLVVPKGKRSSVLILEDGSKVWVNSGSTFSFPVSFNSDKREVFVEGEIYIEVARDTKRPFFVKTPDMHVKVLGTRFNVSAYKEDASQFVVLVEGLVEVQSKDKTKKKVLLPDQMLTMRADAINISKVNTYDYISWKDGLLQFRSQPLSEILAKLSRYYDMEIESEPDIKNMRCTGKLVLFDDPKDVFETISHTISLEKTVSNNVPVSYEINGNHVLIKKK